MSRESSPGDAGRRTPADRGAPAQRSDAERAALEREHAAAARDAEAGGGAPPIDPEVRELGHELRRSVAVIYRRFRSLRAQGDLGESATEVLAALTATGPQSLSELADRDRVALSTISQTVNRLEQLGLVRREPDPRDGRRVSIVPTEAGAEIAAVDRVRRHAWFDRILADLPAEDRAVLDRAARILRDIGEA
ncbi:MarR family transcriptional regulator [Schumannella luteola]|uniref:DNA-binding MarR family transcriptional regulator n=1 Tax=Schumannella luteola TaxID=472059 RepID=A0A852YHX5_9MICO|nr:DNA-binding MarR family transcriptional regulator [Schumannella luteola]